MNEWWNNDIGDPEQVLKPFESLEVKGSSDESTQVTAVGRNYGFGALGLPCAIESNDGPVMAGPVRIVVVVDGQKHVLKARGEVDVTGKQPWRVEFQDTAKRAGLEFSATGWKGELKAKFKPGQTCLITLDRY